MEKHFLDRWSLQLLVCTRLVVIEVTGIGLGWFSYVEVCISMSTSCFACSLALTFDRSPMEFLILICSLRIYDGATCSVHLGNASIISCRFAWKDASSLFIIACPSSLVRRLTDWLLLDIASRLLLRVDYPSSKNVILGPRFLAVNFMIRIKFLVEA